MDEQKKQNPTAADKSRPEHFEQIDPNKQDQHTPAGNSPDRPDENLKGAILHNDPIPTDAETETVQPGLIQQSPNTGESAAGGFPE